MNILEWIEANPHYAVDIDGDIKCRYCNKYMENISSGNNYIKWKNLHNINTYLIPHYKNCLYITTVTPLLNKPKTPQEFLEKYPQYGLIGNNVSCRGCRAYLVKPNSFYITWTEYNENLELMEVNGVKTGLVHESGCIYNK